MTLTDAIERALPRIPAGIVSGDLTDPDDRRAFAHRLALIYSAAFTSELAREVESFASDAWPPPERGTHESELFSTVRSGSAIGLPGTGADETYNAALAWSRAKEGM